MPIGEFLAAARHRAGLSVAQVSERTRIRETIISSIESGDYSACGGDFYARGHIRAIAKAVEVDAGPLIQEYDSLHRAPGAVSAVSLEELLSASAQASPRRRARLPAVGGVAAAAWAAVWSRVNLAAVRDLAAQACRPLGRRTNWQPVLALALVAAVAGFGLYTVLSGAPGQAVAAPSAAQAGQAQQHARPDSGFPAGRAAPGSIPSQPGAHSRATLRRSVLVAATPVRSHNDLRSAPGRRAHRPGTQHPLRHARPGHGHHHGRGHPGHGHHGHGHHGRWRHGHGHHAPGHHGHGHHGHGQA
jgi:transcriptional regulator with XRE-family HTH domain